MMTEPFASRRGIRGLRCRPGHAIIEAALLAPWMLLLFAAIFDFGSYANWFISVENAARAAALHTSIVSEAADDNYLACSVVLAQLKTASNVRNLTTCDAAPLHVTATAATDTEGFITTRVLVEYQTPNLFPLPFMPGQLTLRRSAEMRVRP